MVNRTFKHRGGEFATDQQSSSDDEYDYDEVTRLKNYDEARRKFVTDDIKEEWVTKRLSVGYGGIKHMARLIAKDLSKMDTTIANHGIVVCTGRYELVGKQIVSSVYPFTFVEYRVKSLICRPNKRAVLACTITCVNRQTRIAIGNFTGDIPVRIIKVPPNVRNGAKVTAVFESVRLSDMQPYLHARYRGAAR